jgi:hypothetical protein
MKAQERLQRLQHAEWILGKAIPQWIVEPPNYTASHQRAILTALSAARDLLRPVVEDTENELKQTQEQA